MPMEKARRCVAIMLLACDVPASSRIKPVKTFRQLYSFRCYILTQRLRDAEIASRRESWNRWGPDRSLSRIEGGALQW